MLHVPFFVLVLLFLTLGVLIAGLIMMAVGGKKNKTYSTRLMILRIVMQASVILCLGILYLLYR